MNSANSSVASYDLGQCNGSGTLQTTS